MVKSFLTDRLTRRERVLLAGAAMVLALVVAGPDLIAQLAQSGGPGSTVTLGAGSAKVGVVTTDQTTHGTTDLVAADQVKIAGTAVDVNSGNKSNGTQRIVLATDQPNLTTALNVSLAALPALATGTNVIGVVKSVPSTTCGTTPVSQQLVAVPTSSTLIASFSATTCMIAVFFQNSNAGTQTVTLTDNTGTPLNAVGPAFVVPGLSNVVIPLYGIPFNAGVKWAAGGTGVLGGAMGYQ